MTDMTHFDLSDDGSAGFEGLSHENGNTYWWQSDLMAALGYESPSAFTKPISKAMQACTVIGVSVPDSFAHAKREEDGELVDDCKLSRFACYLVAMNADPRKPQVAKAQAYFAGMTEVARKALNDMAGLERVLIRDEMTDAEKMLSSAAKAAGVQNYAFFQNKGYMGLYNMSLNQIRARKGVDAKQVLLDFMGKEELAANLFRVTQTEAKIKNDRVRGQYNLEETAFQVGRKVRETIQNIGGTPPEQLPPSEDIKEVRRSLKQTHKEFTNIDKKALTKPKKKKGS